MNKGDRIFEALTNIEEQFITEAHKSSRKHTGSVWKQITAAAFAVIAVIGIILLRQNRPESESAAVVSPLADTMDIGSEVNPAETADTENPADQEWMDVIPADTGSIADAEYAEASGMLFPTWILPDYRITDEGIRVYGEEPKVLQADYFNEKTGDHMMIKASKNAYFPDAEYETVIYGDRKADGTRTASVMYEDDGYTILYFFEQEDPAELQWFEHMVQSAFCFQKKGENK